MQKPNKEVINATNKIIKNSYKYIQTNNLELEAENIIKEKFEDNYVFENFFKDYLRTCNDNLSEVKDKIIQEIVDMLFYNDGDISIEEMSQIINDNLYNNKSDTLRKKVDIEPETLCVEINNSYIEISENMNDDEQEKLINKTKHDEKKENKIEIPHKEHNTPNNQKKNSFLSEFLRTIIPTALLTFLFICIVGQLAIVCGDSMNDTLSDGDIIFIEKITQRFSTLKRFDIIVFDSGIENKEEFIKRIIAVPGDKIRIDNNGKIYINGEILTENYGKDTMYYSGIATNTITLAKDEYFVLGDNRNNSEDSRFEEIGLVNITQIKGKVCFSIIPFKLVE